MLKKKITKIVHNNKVNSVKSYYKMDTIFMNAENSKSSDPHKPILHLPDKLNLKKSDKYIAAPTWNDRFELTDGSFCVKCYRLLCEYQQKA